MVRKRNAWFHLEFDRDGVARRWMLPSDHDERDTEIMRRVVDALPRVVNASEARTDFIEVPKQRPSAWFSDE